jgi:RNA ligase (TIGR02306 family)
MKSNLYWFPFYSPGVISLLSALSSETEAKIVILFGEIYGRSVQSLDYGILKGKGFGYRAFDICVDGKYRDYAEFTSLCSRFGVEMAPLVYRGPFSLSKIKEVTEGKTLISGADHIREGVVVRPMHERIDPAVGRAILKYISTEYSLSKHKDADTTDV